MSFVRPQMYTAAVIVLLLTGVFLAACSTTRDSDADARYEIAVSGMVSVRGNEPFTGIVLVTGDRNSYVLSLESAEAASNLRRQAPGRFRVSGVPYKDFWQGTNRAHLRVVTWEKMD